MFRIGSVFSYHAASFFVPILDRHGEEIERCYGDTEGKALSNAFSLVSYLNLGEVTYEKKIHNHYNND